MVQSAPMAALAGAVLVHSAVVAAAVVA